MRALLRLLRPPHRRSTIRILIVVLLLTAICWYFGTDVWHAIALGSVIATVFLVARVAAALDIGEIAWGSHEPNTRRGSRSDVAELSWSLRGSYGRVGNQAIWRVTRLARRRLARHDLDLRNPADRPRIEQLIGRRAYVTLVRGERRRPALRSLLRCLDALDALGSLEQTSSTSARKRSRRRAPDAPRRPRRIHGR